MRVASGYGAVGPKLVAVHELAQPAVAGVHAAPPLPGPVPELALAVERELAPGLELAVASDSWLSAAAPVANGAADLFDRQIVRSVVTLPSAEVLYHWANPSAYPVAA